MERGGVGEGGERKWKRRNEKENRDIVFYLPGANKTGIIK